MTDLAQAKALVVAALRERGNAALRTFTDTAMANTELSNAFESGSLRIVSGEVLDALEAVAKAATPYGDCHLSHNTPCDNAEGAAILCDSLQRLNAARRKAGA